MLHAELKQAVTSRVDVGAAPGSVVAVAVRTYNKGEIVSTTVVYYLLRPVRGEGFSAAI